jgi:hypothetical protein
MVERTKKTSLQAARQICPMPCPEEYAQRLQTLRFSGHYGWIQKQLIELKINKQNCSLTAKNASRNTANRRGPDCFICCGRKTSKGFAKTEVCIYFPKVGNHQLRAIQTTTAAPQAAQLLLEQSYKGVLLQSQINRKSFNGIISYVCTAKLTNWNNKKV